MLRFTRFFRGKIWCVDIGPCKRFDIFQVCLRTDVPGYVCLKYFQISVNVMIKSRPLWKVEGREGGGGQKCSHPLDFLDLDWAKMFLHLDLGNRIPCSYWLKNVFASFHRIDNEKYPKEREPSVGLVLPNISTTISSNLQNSNLQARARKSQLLW